MMAAEPRHLKDALHDAHRFDADERTTARRIARVSWLADPRILVRRTSDATLFALPGLESTVTLRWEEGIVAGVDSLDEDTRPWFTSIAVIDLAGEHARRLVESVVGTEAAAAALRLLESDGDVMVELSDDDVALIRQTWPEAIQLLHLESGQANEVADDDLDAAMAGWSLATSWSPLEASIPGFQRNSAETAARLMHAELEISDNDFIERLIGRPLSTTEYWPLLQLDIVDGVLTASIRRLPGSPVDRVVVTVTDQIDLLLEPVSPQSVMMGHAEVGANFTLSDCRPEVRIYHE